MVLWTVWVEWKARGEFRSSVGNLWIMELVGSVFRIACGAQYGCLPMRMVWKHARTQAAGPGRSIVQHESSDLRS